MFKMRVALLGVLALFIASGITASVASAAGPYWHVNGSRLESGTFQNALQNKGVAVLNSEIGTTKITITCTASESEGATIEGNGTNQGQDKGQIKYSGCTVNVPKCVVENITTKPTKSHLVTWAGPQSKFADLFEPTEGNTFATVKIVKGAEACLVAAVLEVKGAVAAEIVPKEKEGQEGLLNFPSTPINEVFLEGTTKKNPALLLGSKAAAFSAAYSSKLGGTKFGVFGS